MIESAIFDIDGTLIDSVEGHAQAWAIAFQEHGFTADLGEVRRQIGKGSDQLLPCFLKLDEVRRVGQAIEGRQSELFKSSYLAAVRPFPKVRDLFERLRRDGVKCVLASSGKRADVDRAEAIADIKGLVDAVATSEDVDRSKPAPDVIEAALRRITPTPPSACVFIGDTPWDAEAAKRAGVIAVGVSGRVFSDDELRAAGCQRVFENIADLLNHYDDAGRLI